MIPEGFPANRRLSASVAVRHIHDLLLHSPGSPCREHTKYREPTGGQSSVFREVRLVGTAVIHVVQSAPAARVETRVTDVPSVCGEPGNVRGVVIFADDPGM